MIRPLSYFFSDKDISRAKLYHGRTVALCLGCEQPVGRNGYYRLGSLESGIHGCVCPACMRPIRKPMVEPRPHFDEADTAVPDTFSKLGDE